MSKTAEVITVILVTVAVVVLAIVFGLNGVKNSHYNYLKLEVNPQIEFLTNRSNKIITVFPLNQEAKELIIGEKFIGLKAADAATKFVDLCTQANYIDVERQDNAVKLTAVSGLLQNLEVKVYRNIKKYFKANEIKSLIVEGYNDLEQNKVAKTQSVNSYKLALAKSVCNLYPNISLEQAKKLTEKKLILKIKTAHEALYESVHNYSTAELTDKVKLIDFNRAKILHHKENINKKSQQAFNKEYEEYVDKNLSTFEESFAIQHSVWKDTRQNSLIA